MSKFDIKNYPGKYVMHCKTEEEAENFCNYMHSIGRKWCDSDSYKYVTRYHIYTDETVYFFNNNTYCYIDYAQEKGYTILEWSDFMNKKFTKADLKTGDVILRRNGSVEIVNRELGMLIRKHGWNDLDAIREDLTDTTDSRYDIVAVKRPTEKGECQFCVFEQEWGTLVYERPEVEEMTLAEVCKALGREIKIVKE